MTSDS